MRTRIAACVLALTLIIAGPAMAQSYEDLTDAQRTCLLERAAEVLGYAYVPYEDPETMVMVHDVAYELWLEGECHEEVPAPTTREEAILAYVNDRSVTQAQLETAVKRGYEYGGIPGYGDHVATEVAASIVANRPYSTLRDLMDRAAVGTESMEGLEITAMSRYFSLGGPSVILDFVNDKKTTARTLKYDVKVNVTGAGNVLIWRENGSDGLAHTKDDVHVPFDRIFGSADYWAYTNASRRWPANSLDDVPHIGIGSIQQIFDHAMANPTKK